MTRININRNIFFMKEYYMMKEYCEIISPGKSRELRRQEEPGGELNTEDFQEQDPVRLQKRPYGS
jgi:hypothetical protein